MPRKQKTNPILLVWSEPRSFSDQGTSGKEWRGVYMIFGPHEIYSCLKHRVLLYVGRSGAGWRRLSSHRDRWVKKLDEHYDHDGWEKCCYYKAVVEKRHSVEEVEKRLIYWLAPAYNSSGLNLRATSFGDKFPDIDNGKCWPLGPETKIIENKTVQNWARTLNTKGPGRPRMKGNGRKKASR